MASITACVDTDSVLLSYIPPCSYQNGLRVCKLWREVLQTAEIMQKYVATLSSERMKEIRPPLFKKLLTFFSLEQLTQFDERKITRVLLNNFLETPENRNNLMIAKLSASLNALRGSCDSKFYFFAIDFFIAKENCRSEGYIVNGQNVQRPPFLASDWEDICLKDKGVLITILKIEFTRYHWMNSFRVSLSPLLFEAFCSALEVKGEPFNITHHIVVRSDEQLQLFSRSLKSSGIAQDQFMLELPHEVSAMAFKQFKINFMESKITKIFFVSPKISEFQEDIKPILDHLKRNSL